VSVLNLCSGVTSQGGHALGAIYGTEDPPVAPKLRHPAAPGLGAVEPQRGRALAR
jgi:hypothetical protein